MTDNPHRGKQKRLSPTTVKECVKSERYIMARIMWWKEMGLHHTYVPHRVGLRP